MGYHRAGFDVVGVDIAPQPNYPFEFWQRDALEHFGWDDFAAIHASPPCQHYAAVTRSSVADAPSQPWALPCPWCDFKIVVNATREERA
jgi:DNA (cytosine-5)-methyltransferase 1